MKNVCIMLASVLALSACHPSVPAEVIQLPTLFSDHMVLQRDSNVLIWGKATPNTRVTVQFENQKAEVDALEDSSWSVTLAPEPAGGPYTLTVSGVETITIGDVLVGEVWLASGQSNMEWSVQASNNAEAEIAAANDDQLRLFTVQRTIADRPRDTIPGDGWKTTSPETVPGFSAVAYYFGRVLRDSLQVPVGLIHSSWGGTRVEAWTSGEALSENADYAELVRALQANPDEMNSLAPDPQRLQHTPTVLYNGMIHPLVPYALKGAIWYQGESNAGRAHQYQTLFPLLIEDWRKKWERQIAFHFVQLANFMEQQKNPVEKETWPELREAQTMTLTLPNTGMAVTIDIGEASDIHPRNKQDVGLRLALSALHTTYGHNNVAAGPLYKSSSIDGNEVRIQFDHTGSGLTTSDGGPLKGFAIAGADSVFYWADARIDQNEVVVSSDQVTEPAAVRYGWANNPIVNLSNEEGLPASPFRTDDWPGITVGVK